MTRKTLLGTVAASALIALMVPAKADILTPATFSASIGLGGSVDIANKVGTITAGTPTSAQADVLFLSDTTGSMGPAIIAVQTTFGATVSALAGLGNVATGAAQYRDAASAGDAFDYQLNQAITTNSAATQTAINGWAAGGGGDDPEQGLFALTQASGAATGWRAGSKKIAVITGDAPSHDVAHPIAAGGATVANTAAALVAAGVTVESLNASNITGDTGLNAFGQFSGAGSIYAAGAAGSFTGAFPSTGDLTALLTALIGSAFSTYSDVSLDLVGPAPSCVSVGLPSDITGSFDRSIDRSFAFGPVTITGIAAGTCSFTIALEADGAILATESDTITVGSVPEPATIGLIGLGLAALGFARRRKSA